MPETAPRELMVMVERIVRPLSASLKSKKRLRDELLQHLSAIHAEELSRNGDPIAAMTRAKARFGDPAALTAEFQQINGRGERLRRFVERCVMQRCDETFTHYTLRLIGLQLALTSALLFWSPVRFLLALLVFMAVGFEGLIYFGLNWGAEWNHHRRGVRLALLSLGLIASFPAGLALMLSIAGWSPGEFALSWSIPLGWALFGVLSGPVLGVLHARDMAYLNQWAELELPTE